MTWRTLVAGSAWIGAALSACAGNEEDTWGAAHSAGAAAGGESSSDPDGGASPQAGASAEGGAGPAGEAGNASAMAGSSAVADPGLGEIGQPCKRVGLLACSGRAQQVTLICSEEQTWEHNETCDEAQRCDSSSGRAVGLCKDVVAGCETQDPGATFCRGAKRLECGPDLVTAREVETCPYGCDGGVCVEGEGDPCPTPEPNTVIINCADDCGGRSARCADVSCTTGNIAVLGIYNADPDARVVLRLPAAGDDFLCACPEVFGLRLGLAQNLKVTVASPWALISEENVCADAAPSQCALTGDAPGPQFALTSDPGAPPRNLVMEPADSGATCD